MKEDVRYFVEAHKRLQGSPPKLPACLEEVWKKLQKFSMDDPLSFYELTTAVQAMFTFPKAHRTGEEPESRRVAKVVPARPWRDLIIAQGFASFDESKREAQSEGELVIHDLVYNIFAEHILAPRPDPVPPGIPRVASRPATPMKFRLKGKKKSRKK
jgi:hypothetical protein